MVVVRLPLGDLTTGVRQIEEPVFVQALIAEFAVEALDVAVLHRSPRRDEVQLDSVLIGPLVHHLADELRPVVDHDHLRFTSLLLQSF